jgi:hypothetical protein
MNQQKANSYRPPQNTNKRSRHAGHLSNLPSGKGSCYGNTVRGIIDKRGTPQLNHNVKASNSNADYEDNSNPNVFIEDLGEGYATTQ